MIQNLIPNNATHLKTLLALHRIHNHIAMDANKVLAIEYSILVLASRINDFQPVLLISISDHFAKGVFDRRVVRVDEVTVYELDSERALAYIYTRQRCAQWR